MLNLERNVLLAAIGAGACPLLKQIFSQFVAEKGPLLVFASLDLWMLQLLQNRPLIARGIVIRRQEQHGDAVDCGGRRTR